ncbi:MAG: ABC transporter substrate-binding protein [Burkholderiales bacterium]|nr:ABC transporter substrate-binding protein [Burkholderiales bacterium]
MLKTKLKSVLLLALALSAPALPAQEVAPNVLLQSITLEVITAMKRERDLNGGQPAQVASLVETKVLPLFDFPRMTRIAVARNWRLATGEQQLALTAAFKTLLVRTYSTALSSYRDQVIEFRSLHSAPADTEVTVKSLVKQPGTAPIAMDYDMEKTPAGWKVFDIKVAGISLVTTYRDSFAAKIRDGGVDGLIKALEEKNRQGDSRPAAAAS